jgi:hypothetical protein
VYFAQHVEKDEIETDEMEGMVGRMEANISWYETLTSKVQEKKLHADLDLDGITSLE